MLSICGFIQLSEMGRFAATRDDDVVSYKFQSHFLNFLTWEEGLLFHPRYNMTPTEVEEEQKEQRMELANEEYMVRKPVRQSRVHPRHKKDTEEQINQRVKAWEKAWGLKYYK